MQSKRLYARTRGALTTNSALSPEKCEQSGGARYRPPPPVPGQKRQSRIAETEHYTGRDRVGSQKASGRADTPSQGGASRPPETATSFLGRAFSRCALLSVPGPGVF